MEYAKSLIEKKAGKNAAAAERAATSGSDGDMDDDAEEESWTFIGDDTAVDDDGDIDIGAIMKRSQFLTGPPDAERSRVLGSQALLSTSTILHAGGNVPHFMTPGQRDPGPGPWRSTSIDCAAKPDEGQ